MRITLAELAQHERKAVQIMDKLCSENELVHADLLFNAAVKAGIPDKAISRLSARVIRQFVYDLKLQRTSNFTLSRRKTNRSTPMIIWKSLVYQSK